MRRLLRSLAAASVVAAIGLTSACGVVADDRAAVVHGSTVTVDEVDELAGEADFVSVVTGGEPVEDDASVLPGDAARSVLLFEIQRLGLLHEAERWGVEVDDERRQEGIEQVRQQLPEAEDAPEAVLRRLGEFVAARAALDERFSSLDTDSDQDLRAFYDGAPALWTRSCVLVVQVPAELVDRTAGLVRRGASPERVLDRVEDARLVADPEESCLPLEQLPPELRVAVGDARVGDVAGPVVESDGTGYVYRLDGTQQLSFDDARAELGELAEALSSQGAAPWIGLTLLDGVWINPRYGSGLVVGPTGDLQVAAPDAPQRVAPAFPELTSP